MIAASRVAVLGLDACEPSLLQQWCKEGRLPFFQSLIDKGTYSRLTSAANPLFADVPWATFHTAVNPGRHGWFNFFIMKEGTHSLYRGGAYDLRYLPFWAALRNTGRRVAVLDVPKSYPVAGVEGVQMCSWGEHYPLIETASIPADFSRELRTKFGRYPHLEEIASLHNLRAEKTFLKDLSFNLEKKLNAAEYTMKQVDWDLLLTVFAESHYAGHQFFHHAVKEHWAHSPTLAGSLGGALPGIYRQLDSAAAEIHRILPEDVTVFVISVHGIGANHSANRLMPQVMETLGLQCAPGSNNGSPLSRGIFKKLRERVPPAMRAYFNERLMPERIRDRLHFHVYSESIDWRRSRAFFLPSDQFQGFIRLNVKGREPEGIVSQDEYDSTCDEIRTLLLELLNPATGGRAVADVVQTSRVLSGENMRLMPDLVILWSEDAPVWEIYHPRFGVFSQRGWPLRKSAHAADGFVIAAGKNVRQGAILNAPDTLDLAPTILYMMGLPVPSYMDGRVLHELIDPDYLRLNPIERAETDFLNPNPGAPR